jgi:hypothetical protein
MSDPTSPKGDFWPFLPQAGAPGSRVPSDRESMKAQVGRAEDRLLDQCANLARWLDDERDRASATGRLNEALDDGTIRMLRRGLTEHPNERSGLRRFN